MTLERLVVWALMARVKTAISMAGSASAETSISREAPMPPKAVPTSMPASARKKRASASSPTSTMMSAIAAVGRSDRDQRHGRGRQPGGDEHDVGRGAEQRRGGMGDPRLLDQQFAQVAVGLQHGGAAPVLQPRLDLAHPADQQRRQRGVQQRLQQGRAPEGHRGQEMIHSSISRVASVQPR